MNMLCANSLQQECWLISSFAKQVTVGQVNWLAPTGVIGLHPIASFGPVSVGPGATEGSCAHLPEIRVSIDPLKSILQQKMVLKLTVPGAEVGPTHNQHMHVQACACNHRCKHC